MRVIEDGDVKSPLQMSHLQTDAVGLTALGLLSLAWIVFGLVFLLRKKPPGVQEAKRAPASLWGIFLVSISFMSVWLIGRTKWWPFPPSFRGELVLAVVAVALALASCTFYLLAVHTLGKQWTYRARVIEGHELITTGPYAVVRNPIYLGMFGMLLATGLVYSRWWNFLVAIGFFLRFDSDERRVLDSKPLQRLLRKRTIWQKFSRSNLLHPGNLFTP